MYAENNDFFMGRRLDLERDLRLWTRFWQYRINTAPEGLNFVEEALQFFDHRNLVIQGNIRFKHKFE
jgi:hypothetical protein